MASAAIPSYASTKETTNYARLCRLLVDVGSQALRNKFDSIHPPAGLHGVLTKPPVHPILQTLRKKRILNPTQWAKLYPPSPSSVSSKDFDVTLLMLLLRNVCGLIAPSTGWDNLPPAGDTSAEANIARVKYYRNHVYGHASHASVDDATFNSYWQDISYALVGLGADSAAINRLKTESMDPVIEQHYQQLLREWKKDDDSSKDRLDEIEGLLKDMKKDNDNSRVKLEEQLKNMNDQILESERKIRDKLERLTADPVEEANQEKEKIRDDLEDIKSELGRMGEKLRTSANEDRGKFEEIKGEITAIREKLDALTSAGQESNDQGTCKSKVQLGASSDPAGARSEALDSSKRVLHDQGLLKELKKDGDNSRDKLEDREKFEKIKDEITAIREKLDALTSAGQESSDKGTCGFYPTGFVDGIRQLYSTRERWFAPFPWWEKFRLSLDNNFTRLKIVSRKKERGIKTDETVTMKHIFKPHEECAHPRTVLVEGRPGIGKTTFCNKLAYDWTANKQVAEDPSGSFFPNFEVVLLLKCREIESCLSKATEGQPLPRSEKEKANEIFKSVLWDAIDDQLLPRDCTKEDKEEFFKFIRCNQPEILLILDGLDELPANMFAAFKEVIQGRVLPKCYIVATARQEVGMEVRECCDTLLEIEGFSKEDAREFIFRYFKAEPHLAQKLLNKLESDKNLQQLTESPLNTVLLCLLCEDSDGIFAESGTQLYLEMVECVLRRYRKKKGLPLPNTKDEDLTKVYKTQLRQLGSIAWNGLLHNNLSLEEGEFKNCSEELPEFGFLSVECSPKKVRPSLNYCFLHKTFQELFAAFHLCCQVLDNEICPETLIADNRYFKELKQVLLFTCGMLASQSEQAIKAFVSCIAKQVNDEDRLSVALKCIKECKNEKSCTLHLLLARTLGSLLQITHLDLSWNRLGTGDCTALAEAIKHNSTITQLNFSWNRLCTGDCTALAEAIKHNSTITQLDLSSNRLGTGDCTALAEAIKHNSTITQLNLSLNELGTGDCTALAEAIKHNSTITQLNFSWNRLGTGDCTALAEAIKHNSTITQLNLSGNELGTGDCTALAEAIKHNSTITQLNLSRNELGTGDCTALAEAIKHNSTITQLNLRGNELGTGDCTALAEAIKHNSTITQLDLSFNGLGTGDCTALAEAIKHNSTITQLDLSFNGLGTGDCTALAEAIKHNSTITQLNLSSNRLGTGDCTALAEAIKHNSTITQLNLSRNELGTGDSTALVEVIKHNSTITQLNLSQNKLGTGDCTALAEAIKHNSTITQLNLSSNRLGTGDCTALAEAIKHNSTITQLDLSSNRLGTGDCTALAEAIKHNSTITQLNLSRNELGTGDSTALVEVIKHNSTITQLNLSQNKLGTGDCTALAEAIKHNSTITQLNLSSNRLGTGDCTALAEAIKHNSTITQLDLSSNRLGTGDCTALAEAIKHNSTITQLNF
ncbi:uncharacterized protein [Porites lutea]|uniref:uncharacterized protein n=1 Tax=Porites lutea TaxID=51062 RepID=UPI003CC5D0A7